MKATRTYSAVQKEPVAHRTDTPLFDKSNKIWMLAGAVVMILGFLMMAGGRSDNPQVFEPGQVYSTTRITLAPIVILAGLVIEIFAIFRHPKA
ncbi:DUF3098 domain-containing protein [Paraflavisolibacter sp. H34]|uniref:DUF3098 domain-containing protein n=1 Tax=Huijunlia imazamoxiresistens TaxID=3127457 RepID=UPI003015A2C4